jgi:hypothetical protein
MRRRNFLELGESAVIDLPAARTRPRASSPILAWNAIALCAIRAADAGTAHAARALNILHTSMYNAWAAYDGTARQAPPGHPVRLPRAERSAANARCAMHHAAWRALAACLPAQRAIIDAQAAGLDLDPGPATLLSPAGIGRTQAQALLDANHAQGEAAQATLLPSGEAQALADWCLAARDVCAREGLALGRDAQLYFALAGALADAAAAGARVDTAAAEVLRRCTGGSHLDACGARDDPGRRIGALAYDRARHYWQGKPQALSPGV